MLRDAEHLLELAVLFEVTGGCGPGTVLVQLLTQSQEGRPTVAYLVTTAEYPRSAVRPRLILAKWAPRLAGTDVGFENVSFT
jgi:hypothetical protein